MTRSVALALAALFGCSSDTAVDLVLTEQASCSTDDYSAISVVSVEVLGDDGGQVCALAKRCVFGVEMIDGLAALTETLRQAEPPLVDIALEGARTVAVFGHRQSCWQTTDLAVFGFNDLSDRRDGQLSIELTCGADFDLDIPFCP